MFERMQAKRRRKRAGQRAVAQLASAARDPGPFAKGWYADTFDGRFLAFGVLAAAVLLSLRRKADADLAEYAEALEQAVYAHLDYSVRETGVGDSGIARKIRKLGERWTGLGRAMAAAADGAEPSEALAAVLERNGVSALGARPVAERVLELKVRIDAEAPETLAAGKLPLPG